MSADGSKLRDVSALADERAVVPVEFPVSALARLVPELAAPSGTARGELRFGRDQDTAMADVAVEATLELVCQRCMRPMSRVVSTGSRVYFPPDEDAAAALAADAETMLAPEGRVRLADVVGEELLLALPLVPRHEDEEDCDAPAAQAVEDAPAREEPRRPFANLAELMGREKR